MDLFPKLAAAAYKMISEEIVFGNFSSLKSQHMREGSAGVFRGSRTFTRFTLFNHRCTGFKSSQMLYRTSDLPILTLFF